MHLLFLLTQKLRRDGVQCITTQLVLALHVLKHVKLQATVEDCIFRVALSKRLRREVRIFHLRLHPYFARNRSVLKSVRHERMKHTLDSSEKCEVLSFERFRSVHQIGEIEIGDVVANDDIRIHLLDEVSPCLEHFRLVLERKNL